MPIAEHAVVIAGGGPTGMMLASELTLAGANVAIVERRDAQELVGARALGMYTRSIEELDQRGIAERFLSQGQLYKVVHFQIPLDVSDLPTRHNYILGLAQKHIERIMAEWIAELAVPIYRRRDVTGFAQDDSGVDVRLSDGDSLRAQYLVGCDGGRSVIRKSAGIDFPGWDASTSWLIAEAEMLEEPPWGFRETAFGTHAIAKGDNPKQVRMVLMEREVRSDSEPTLQEVREALIAVYETDFGIHNPSFISRFTDMARQATAYRNGRILLAGDAAHVHAPLGGQGLNLGVQDAVNLGWKLAQVIEGTSPDTLLDTYHAERHSVGARVLKSTMAHVALRRPDDRSKALAEYIAEFMKMEEPRKRMAAEIVGLTIRYEFGGEHPLLGRRMPDLEIVTANGPGRVYSLLHKVRPALLNFGESGALALDGWTDRVQLVDAKYSGVWELPALGRVAAPKAVLVRPDGYVAWVGNGTDAGLRDALTGWFGAPGRRAG